MGGGFRPLGAHGRRPLGQTWSQRGRSAQCPRCGATFSSAMVGSRATRCDGLRASHLSPPRRGAPPGFGSSATQRRRLARRRLQAAAAGALVRAPLACSSSASPTHCFGYTFAHQLGLYLVGYTHYHLLGLYLVVYTFIHQLGMYLVGFARSPGSYLVGYTLDHQSSSYLVGYTFGHRLLLYRVGYTFVDYLCLGLYLVVYTFIHQLGMYLVGFARSCLVGYALDHQSSLYLVGYTFEHRLVLYRVGYNFIHHLCLGLYLVGYAFVQQMGMYLVGYTCFFWPGCTRSSSATPSSISWTCTSSPSTSCGALALSAAPSATAASSATSCMSVVLDCLFDDFMSDVAIARALLTPAPPGAVIRMSSGQYLAIGRRVLAAAASGATTEEQIMVSCQGEMHMLQRVVRRLIDVDKALEVVEPSPNPWRPERRVLRHRGSRAPEARTVGAGVGAYPESGDRPCPEAPSAHFQADGGLDRGPYGATGDTGERGRTS